MIRKTGIALAAIGLLTLTGVAPVTAQARGWDHRGWGHDWRGHRDSGAGVALGIFGALAGVAIASTQPYYAAPYSYSPYYYAPAYGYGGYGYYR
jgi:hypothetical protein